MVNKDDVWLPIHLFCPNCGQKLIGYKAEDGNKIKYQCPRCKVATFNTLKRGKIDLELDAPKGSVAKIEIYVK